MPFASKRQARYLFATHPAVAKEFAAATPSIKALPERSGSSLMRARRRRRRQLSGPPQASGQPINGASLSTSRIGY